MATIPSEPGTALEFEAPFAGLRMSVDEFLHLPEDVSKYELLDGVVVMSPRPTPAHQRAAREIVVQLSKFLDDHPIGEVFFELDVYLGSNDDGKDLVYAPDVIFLESSRLVGLGDKIIGAPNLAVEVISRGSRSMDTVTKRDDYEAFGVREYWILDPAEKSITFLRLQNRKFVEVAPQNGRFASEAVPGFMLDVAAVHETFKPW